jgi:type I restriction enzyme, S subunit
MSELPYGWACTNMANIGRWSSGGTPSRSRAEYFGQGVPWVKSGDLTDGVILSTEEQITELGLNNSSAKLMPPGTISIALYGATIGKLGLLSFPAATNQACANVVPNKELIEPQYLFFYLMSQKQALVDKGQGGAQPNISQDIVKTHPTLLAPLNEQRRIVAKLLKLLNRVNAAQTRLASIPLILKRFRQSVLAAACSGRLTADWRNEHPHPISDFTNGDSPYEIPKSWSCRTFESISREITVGFVGPMAKEYVESGMPFLRSLNVRPFRFDPTNIRFISPDFHRTILKSRLTPGDVAIVRSGNSGIACVIPESLPEANCSDLVILRPASELVAAYACLFMNSSAAQAHVNSVKVGIAQGHFNVGSMKSTVVPLPPVAEQQEIVRRVDALFKTADALESRYRKAKAHVDKLTQSILAKAFRGELVPQDPNDEPAAALLERIRSEPHSIIERKGKSKSPRQRQKAGI